jgi:fructose/tagatose bisphosphate aldolase
VLVTNKNLMIPARKKGYVTGAFNVQNLESTLAIAEAATEEKLSSHIIFLVIP